MRKYSIAILSALALMMGARSEACTNVLVTKGASTDGSNMISYAADSHQLFGELYFKAGHNLKNPGMRSIYNWDTNAYMGQIPEASQTFQRVGNINVHQLVIGETTYGGREELWEQDGAIMDYGSLIYVALERCKTAREAIGLIYELCSQYGYASEGESFSLADKDEVWVMDLIGKGNYGKGIVYVARRVPDGYICSHANQARITTFPMDKPQECMYSPDVISFARERGYFSGDDKDFSFADAYAPLDFGAMRGCEARAWSAFNILCDGVFTYMDETGAELSRPAMDFIEYAMGHDRSKRFPLFVKPSRKLSIEDVARVMRDHYEGTPMDMTTDIGAGGNALPYRWRPMTFKSGDNTYYNERAIATQQTGFWFVAQSRGYLPDNIGALIWFGCDDAATSYLTPMYACTSRIPLSFREGNGDMLHYSATSAFWMCNRIANACYRAYDMMAPTVQGMARKWENACLQKVAAWDQAALAMKNVKAREKYLTDACCSAADEIFAQWARLEEFLLVKYIDGNVKAQNEDGSWVTNGNGNIPDNIRQPGYSQKWKDAVAADHGKTLIVVEPK
ncbi:MAG: C69 family dipeptidase [Bacteroidales bacterium]|nr:C69 family dipeptidase [Bacteroidales bacterium]